MAKKLKLDLQVLTDIVSAIVLFLDLLVLG